MKLFRNLSNFPKTKNSTQRQAFAIFADHGCNAVRKTVVLAFTFLFFAVQLQAEGTGKKRSWRDYFGSKETDSSSASNKRSYLSDTSTSHLEGMVDLIDAPTTNVVEYGGYRLNFRLYSQGGVQSHLSFGVFRRLNLGVTWDNERIIGTDDGLTNTPTVYVKLRAYDGGPVLPSLAIGYDGQGRFFNRSVDEYTEAERGLYFSLSRELFLPDLEWTGGVNISRFKDGKVYGFMGLSYLVDKKLALLTEYDNIRVGPKNRWNAGIRIFPLPSLSIDFAFRRIASLETTERIVRINWVGSF